MKYQRVRKSKNSWTCKCGNFYHHTTTHCRDCKTVWEKFKLIIKSLISSK